MLQQETKELALQQSQEILDLFSNIQDDKTESIIKNVMKTEFPFGTELNTDQMCFYKINKLSYDEDYPRREAFENVLYSLDNRAFNFVYMITGSKTGVEICLGVVANHEKNEPVLGRKLSAVNYGQIIASAFEGNFNGSDLTKYEEEDLQEKIIKLGSKYNNAGIIMGIPSINESDAGEDYDFQGVDRLINSMLGLEWRMVVVCEPVDKKEIIYMQEELYELYNRLALYSKASVQMSENSGSSISAGTNQSDSKGKSREWSETDSRQRGTANSSGTRNSGTSKQIGKSGGSSSEHSEGSNTSYSANRGSSKSVTVEMANKHAQDLMKYIDEELLRRMKIGHSKGFFKTSVYYMSDKPAHADRLKAAIMSLFQGNKSTFSPLIAKNLDLSSKENKRQLCLYQNSYIACDNVLREAMLLLGHPMKQENVVGLSAFLTTSEISILAGLPQKEVPGLSLKEGVDFGLNTKDIGKGDKISLGVMVQKGRTLDDIPFYLNKEAMSKHTFVAGVTGSGKTTTCQKLLIESKTPFLVIEPAKTEYRVLLKDRERFGEVHVFTLGNETVAPFRINPFELVEGEIISAHVDMLKATFTSAFPMEASMPQILEEAIYKCYENKGWNIDDNTNTQYEDPFSHKESCFPIMSELLDVMREIVKTKGFSAQMQADYEGSLVSRLSNLTVGSKGRMLDCPYSIDFDYLINHNVILEMEELKSPEDKALFMGLILSRLSVVIKKRHQKDNDFKHLTLIEEAHRLLAKVEYGDSGSKKAAVETFTDLLAEVRKYGEGLIVVDQIPNKLSSEVLKNTNTKIIHKILAKDDKEAVGDTMLMDDKQKEYLSALETGHVIIFSENTEKPVHVKIQRETDTKKVQLGDEIIKKHFEANVDELGGAYNGDLKILRQYYDIFSEVCSGIAKMEIDKEKCNRLKEIVDKLSRENNRKKEDIWRIFVLNKVRKKHGYEEGMENHISKLVEILTSLFSKKEIDVDDVECLDYNTCMELY